MHMSQDHKTTEAQPKGLRWGGLTLPARPHFHVVTCAEQPMTSHPVRPLQVMRSSSSCPAFMICASGPSVSAMRVEKVPCCSTRPVSDSTAMVSQQRIRARLWVTTSVVGRASQGASTASARAAAVGASRAEVGSSRISTGACRTSARAVATRWRSPPESSCPPLPTGEA
mmetsp:Transcript_5679/g.17535  ORF Transcript_5679/g.17535 Transcript_5679/m.17535 type:complete len:170 (+) Transcript_5679:107-616(+)